MDSQVVAVELSEEIRPSLIRGHPWVYRNHVRGQPDLPSGSWVRVHCGGFSSIGLWDPDSAIAVRLLSRRSVPDEKWVAERVTDAWELRAPIRAGATTAYRWIYGESDGLPGIVVDLYGRFAVILAYVQSVEGLVPWVAEALHAHMGLQGILLRTAGGSGPRPLWGQPPPRDLIVEEHGILYHADLLAGQKSGLYFDQRENRLALGPWCEGRTVLDCFCYVGGFGLHAARSGAKKVTVCDAAGAAVEAARRNFALNGLDPTRHEFITGDCFELLEQLASRRQRYDVVILDPPSFARDRKSRRAAERAYVRLNQLALGCVKPGGYLASASCTSQVSPEAFREALAEAARRANRRLITLHDAGQPIDHPVPVYFVEARYLKFVLSRVMPVF